MRLTQTRLLSMQATDSHCMAHGDYIYGKKIAVAVSQKWIIITTPDFT